jgi:hypothetical protein
MLGYLAILGASLCGLAQLSAWTIGIAAIALMSISHAQYERTIFRARDAGLVGDRDYTLAWSALHALAASAAAYAGGWIVSIV